MQVRLPRKLYFVVFLVMAIAITGAYVAFVQETQRHRSLVAEAPAMVTKTEVRHSVDPETGKQRIEDTIVTFEYVVHGQKYEKVTRIGKVAASSFVPWGEAKVCYDPADVRTIEKPELFPKGHICGDSAY